MDSLLAIWEKPVAQEIYMIAGWRQWADAGSISSGLPQYLIDHLGARKIGMLKPGEFYLFQIPGTHHLLRPTIKLEDGYRKRIEPKKNEFFYAQVGDKGLVIFLGDEPHQDHPRYAQAILDAAAELGVKRVAGVAGVYGAMPYDKERQVSCVFSLPHMRDELAPYALELSNYEGGSTIGTYLADQAEDREIELLVFYAFVPSYDFGKSAAHFTGIQVGKDIKAWYDLMRRLDHMFELGLDLADLEDQSERLISSIETQIDQLAESMPQLNVREYLEEVTREFQEKPFMPLGDLWERELGKLFDDDDDES
jgi:predicted ATP-grasp superfamily ATP-dependent carboligase